ncbi:hypothetical protein [Gudongella sp. SC589]|uniref:hypothetical protein n=1 Tax=Gudongella sp. SC589 TaxID=3385990 RepID=UPI0039048924
MNETHTKHLKPWGVYQFPWGIATKHRKGDWDRVFISLQEIDVSRLDVVVNDDGILIKGIREE